MSELTLNELIERARANNNLRLSGDKIDANVNYSPTIVNKRAFYKTALPNLLTSLCCS